MEKEGEAMKNEINQAYIELLERKDATHLLECSQCYCSTSRVDYFMKCIILKEMPNNRLKILIFGDRFWNRPSDNEKKRIRYVDKFRVKELKEDGK